MVFRFLKSESFWKRSYTPKSVAFGRIRGFSKRLIFLNSVLDTQNDLKPTIIQYNICCTYKKRLDYVVRSKKKWKGGSGGSGEGKNRPKKGHFDPKTAKKCAGGILEPPKHPKKIIYYIYYIIYYILYIIYHISYTFHHFISDFLRCEDFLEVHFWPIFELLMTPTPPEHLISYCLRLWTWFLIIWEGLVWFLDFWKTSRFVSGGISPFPTLLMKYRQSEIGSFFSTPFWTLKMTSNHL